MSNVSDIDHSQESGTIHQSLEKEKIRACWIDLLKSPKTTVWDVFQAMPEYDQMVQHPDIKAELDLISRKKWMAEMGYPYVINPHTDLFRLPYHLITIKDNPFMNCHEILIAPTDVSLADGDTVFLPIKQRLISYSVNLQLDSLDKIRPNEQDMMNLVRAKCSIHKFLYPQK